MLTTEQIDCVRDACNALSLPRANALALAAAHRTLPIYQAYSEGPFGAKGHGVTHDAMVQAWRVLRGRPGVSQGRLGRKVDEAVGLAEKDLELINGAENFGLAESLSIESISTAVLALNAMDSGDRKSVFDALATAIEVDLVWAEWRDDVTGGVVSSDDVSVHYGKQLRDINLLSDTIGADENIMFRDLAMRAEQEGMPYLGQMRDLVEKKVADGRW